METSANEASKKCSEASVFFWWKKVISEGNYQCDHNKNILIIDRHVSFCINLSD